MIFPWSKKKPGADDDALAPEKATLEKLITERKMAAAGIEDTLKKILEIKESTHGSS